MEKVFYLHIVYADCGNNAKGFEPKVFRMEFHSRVDILTWLKSTNNLKAVVSLHSEVSGFRPGAVFLKAVYVDSETCEELGLPDNGTKFEDVVSCMFKRWFTMKRRNGVFPLV